VKPVRTAATLAALAVSLLAPAAAMAAESYGSAEQIAWVRRAARNFVSAELNADGAGACAILNAPLRVTVGHRTCAQRWDARLHALLRRPGERTRLRSERAAIARAVVVVHGDRARIELPDALASDSANRFLWTENCWMLTG
jgi:hypothetical protein